VDDIVDVMERTGATVLIPGHEENLAIARLRERFPARIRIPLADADVLIRSANKWHVVGLAAAAGVAVPNTFKADSRSELKSHLAARSYPAIVKTQFGNSAKGVAVVENPRDAVKHFDRFVRTYGLAPEAWPIVQDFVRGDPYGVCMLYNRGALRAAFCERYLRCKDGHSGTSVFRESVDCPELVGEARKLMDSLEWHGVVHLDFLYDHASGRYGLLEVNPRFWGALDLAVRAGVDFPWLLYRMAVDGDVSAVTSYRLGVRSRWIVGELLHLTNHLRRGRIGSAIAAMSAMARARADGCDDFRRSDPLPLLFELLYYGNRFLMTGAVNPTEAGMIG
jgi:predicted ATP-grasp superfamily ATP-dependent carboligase